ncbi:MAG TPA: hypothetical protein DDX40_09980 [Rikenellaceae bacterium]|nr:hypothetical protein [Rikenellaceae bacterium]
MSNEMCRVNDEATVRDNRSEDIDVRKEAAEVMTDSRVDELLALDNNINSIKSCVDSLEPIVNGVCASVTAWKEIDKEMLAMDLHFKAFAKEMDNNLEKYKSRIPVIEKQLEVVNVGLVKILDYVIAMDAKTEAEMNMKMKMMERVDLFLNTLSTTMMNLL